MKKQTAMMEHIKWLYEVVDTAQAQNMNKDIIQAIEYIIGGAKAKIPMEKEQIIKANRDGVDMVVNEEDFVTGKQYYNETYGGDNE